MHLLLILILLILLLVLPLHLLADPPNELRTHVLEIVVGYFCLDDVGLADLVDMCNLVLEVVVALHLLLHIALHAVIKGRENVPDGAKIPQGKKRGERSRDGRGSNVEWILRVFMGGILMTVCL